MGLGPSPTFTGLDHLQPLQQGQLYWAAQDGGVGVRGAVLSYASSSDGLGQLFAVLDRSHGHQHSPRLLEGY